MQERVTRLLTPSDHDSSRHIVAEVKAATDIADIVGSYIELKPGGPGRFKACCPFHSEKTPSFFVNRDRQSYHCFGCGKGGDVFNFLEELEGLRFPEALRQLADRAGIRLPERNERSQESDDLRERLIELNKFAAGLYWRSMRDETIGSVARDYLNQRKLPEAIAKQFGVGFAPDGWQTLADAAQAKGFRQETLIASGLAKDGREGRPYDLLRNRVIFPIRDLSGRVVAFGGRDLGDSPAKYMNSPESEIYKKSRVLYGLYEGREAIRKESEALIVEGYFDVLRCFAEGVENVVAPCGTALTPEQANLLHRFAKRVVVVFDGDPAGIRAALRSVGILVGAGMSVRALVLPEGLDPDDFVQQRGPEAFRKEVAAAPEWVTFYTTWNKDRATSIEGRTEVAREMFDIVAMLDDALRQDEYIRAIARALQLNEHQCRREFTARSERRPRRDEDHGEPAEVMRPVNVHDREFIAVLMHEPGLLPKAMETVREAKAPANPLTEVIAALGEADPYAAITSREGRALYTAAANADDTWGGRGEAIVLERLRGFRKSALIEARAQIEEAMRSAERSNNTEELDQLVLEKIGLDRRIQQAGAV